MRDVIAEVAETTTVLVTAHRLSTVTDARRILVLEDGRVRVVGTRAELLRRDDVYRRLATTQMLASGSQSGPVSGSEPPAGAGIRPGGPSGP
ncbi:hypothetical protein GCM10009731_08070 [Streptomyces globosus]